MGKPIVEIVTVDRHHDGTHRQSRRQSCRGGVMKLNCEERLAAGREAALKVPASRLPMDWPTDPDQKFELPAYWDVEELPADVRGRGDVSRGALCAMADQARQNKRTWTEVMASSYAWGYALTPYGPFRLRRIVNDDANESRLEGTLRESAELVRDDPLGAYRLLRNWPKDGGGRLKWYGPAFFTKFLFFASGPGRQALILDQLLASGVRRLTGDPGLLRGSSWGTDEYAFYLGFVHQLSCRPAEGSWQPPKGLTGDQLECALFQVELDLRAAGRKGPRTS